MESLAGEASTNPAHSSLLESEEGSLAVNGETAELSSSLLHPPALDHTNAFLSPSVSPSFNVDDFLLSRAPGSSLSQITTDLQEYSINLKNQLNIVVDRDFKGFVNLGAALKAEGPRIARLDWKVAPSGSRSSFEGEHSALTRREGDEEWSQKFDTPRGSGSNLGLDKVRSEVVDVRDQLRKAEEDVRRVMRSKEDAELQKTNLLVILSLDDSLRKLEALLLAPADYNEDEEKEEEEDMSSDGGYGANEHGAQYWQSFSNMEDYEYSDAGSQSSEDGERADTKHRQSTATRPTLLSRRTSSRSRRRSLSPMSARRKAPFGVNKVKRSTAYSAQNSTTTLDLPLRIGRASSEHAALVFLRNRAASIGYNAFIAAHQDRWTRIRELLKHDLRKLITNLTRFGGDSLLVPRASSRKGTEQNGSPYLPEASDLATWATSSESLQAKKKEQLSWLEAALTTWNDLPPSDPEVSANGASEAEEAVRLALVASWARETITADALSKRGPDPRTPKTPFGFGQVDGFAQLQDTSEEGDNELGSEYLLSQNLVEYSEEDSQAQALINLYNEILTFVAVQGWESSQAAERVIAKTVQGVLSTSTAMSVVSKISEADHSSHCCDVFVRVLWNEIGTRLMEQLGGQLFFAGRPEVFHRNYTISKAFLVSFESLAPSDRARKALHQNSTYQAFRKRWQLSVYFQIRLRDTITRLESVLSSSSGVHFGVASAPSKEQQLPLMRATGEALALFASPWKSGNHISELMNRQWKLSLQVLTRYKNWMEDGLPGDIVLANRRNPLDSTRAPGHSSSDGIRTMAPSRAGTPTVVDPEADDALLSTFTTIAADLTWLEERVMEVFDREIAVCLSKRTGGESIVASLRETLQGSLSMQSKILPLLSTRITHLLKSRCAEPLRLVRSVSTQFRTGSVAASGDGDAILEPSSFVIQFLRPVRHYLGKGDGNKYDQQQRRTEEVMSRFLTPSIRSQWMGEVVEDFVARYAASLRTMNKNYESLRRLKRGNTAAGASAAMGFGSFFNRNGSSTPGKIEEDVEAKRMHAQMMTDVECLIKEVQDLAAVDTHVSTDTVEWNKLKEAARGEQDD
ncbi:hypothetical protein CBS101457_004101 [Exobasidium rhododendri]|nr:hypothetical protein CBS101457_004101 [Exobasidium rhododendri]